MTTTETTFKFFALGRIVATQGANETVSKHRIIECLMLHAHGDWGDVCKEDAAENNLSTREGFRILSAYAIDPSKPAKPETSVINFSNLLANALNCFTINVLLCIVYR